MRTFKVGEKFSLLGKKLVVAKAIDEKTCKGCVFCERGKNPLYDGSDCIFPDFRCIPDERADGLSVIIKEDLENEDYVLDDTDAYMVSNRTNPTNVAHFVIRHRLNDDAFVTHTTHQRMKWEWAIPWSKFDPTDIKQSLEYNIIPHFK